jgi:hypothetical protein
MVTSAGMAGGRSLGASSIYIIGYGALTQQYASPRCIIAGADARLGAGRELNNINAKTSRI